MRVVVDRGGKLSQESVEIYDNSDAESHSPSTLGGYDAVADAKRRQSEAAAFAESSKAERNESAEAVAQSYGFSSADDAEDYGIKTGKED